MYELLSLENGLYLQSLFSSYRYILTIRGVKLCIYLKNHSAVYVDEDIGHIMLDDHLIYISDFNAIAHY